MKRNAPFILGLILLLAVVLRLWGLPFGLPNLSRPDEQNISTIVFSNLLPPLLQGHLELNPHFFEYPSLYLYLVDFLYYAAYLVGHLFGIFTSPGQFMDQYYTDWTLFHFLSRSLTALLGILTVWVSYHLGEAFGKSRWVGLATSFLLAVTYLHVRDSHFGVTDVPATFFVTLCLWLAVLYAQTGNLKIRRWACIVAGLAAAIKYPAGLVFLSVAMAEWNLSNQKHWKSFLKETPTLFGWTMLTFFMATPFVLLDFHEFWRDFMFQANHLQAGHILDLGMGWAYHAEFSLMHGLGSLYFLATWAAISLGIYGAVRHPLHRVHWIPLIYLGIFYLWIGNTHTVFVRYVVPLLPVCALYAGWGSVHWARWLAVKFSRPFPLFLVLLLLIISGTSLQQSLQFGWLSAQEDTRTQARNWLIQNLKPEEAVGVGLMLVHVDLPKTYRKYVLDIPEGNNQLGQTTRSFIDLPNQPMFNVTPNARGEFSVSTYRYPGLLQYLGIRYLVMSDTPLTLFPVPPFERTPIERQYKLVAHFSPTPLHPKTPLKKEYFDQLDAFFVPYHHLESVERPGPELFIYEVPLKAQK